MRRQRKIDHVRLALEETDGSNGFADVSLVHNSLPELAVDAVDLSTSLLGIPLAQPVIINAMTGGAAEVREINRVLARVAGRLGCPMAVGSQRAGLEDPGVADTYAVVREVNPDGVILANLGAGATLADARRAMDMIRADILQIHLNAPQELAMAEGDRDFRGQMETIQALASAQIPLLVKECGFGMSRETVRRLYTAGVRAVDIAGYGGTNFVRIESRRTGQSHLDPSLEGWGIPTACSLAEAVDLSLADLDIVASGGIAGGVTATKALAMGARSVAVAGPALQALHRDGEDGLYRFLTQFLADLRTATLLTGAGSLAELRLTPLVIRGAVAEWCLARGVNTRTFARRLANA